MCRNISRIRYEIKKKQPERTNDTLDRNVENTTALGTNHVTHIYGEELIQVGESIQIVGLNDTIVASIEGEEIERYYYSDYGESVQVTGGHGYNGEIKDSNGLIYLRARYYDPSIGRFIQIDNNYKGEDTNILSQNRYAYTLNNPYKYVDRDGNRPLSGADDEDQSPANGYMPAKWLTQSKTKIAFQKKLDKMPSKYHENAWHYWPIRAKYKTTDTSKIKLKVMQQGPVSNGGSGGGGSSTPTPNQQTPDTPPPVTPIPPKPEPKPLLPDGYESEYPEENGNLDIELVQKIATMRSYFLDSPYNDDVTARNKVGYADSTTDSKIKPFLLYASQTFATTKEFLSYTLWNSDVMYNQVKKDASKIADSKSLYSSKDKDMNLVDIYIREVYNNMCTMRTYILGLQGKYRMATEYISATGEYDRGAEPTFIGIKRILHYDNQYYKVISSHDYKVGVETAVVVANNFEVISSVLDLISGGAEWKSA